MPLDAVELRLVAVEAKGDDGSTSTGRAGSFESLSETIVTPVMLRARRLPRVSHLVLCGESDEHEEEDAPESDADELADREALDAGARARGEREEAAHRAEDGRAADAREPERGVHGPVCGEPQAAEQEAEEGRLARRERRVDGDDGHGGQVPAHVVARGAHARQRAVRVAAAAEVRAGEAAREEGSSEGQGQLGAVLQDSLGRPGTRKEGEDARFADAVLGRDAVERRREVDGGLAVREAVRPPVPPPRAHEVQRERCRAEPRDEKRLVVGHVGEDDCARAREGRVSSRCSWG